MRANVLRIAIVAYWVLWSGIIIPGHTRGAVTMPGSEAARMGSACCAASEGHDRSAPPEAPTPAERAHCGVCYLAAVQAPPPPVLDAPAPTGACGIQPIIFVGALGSFSCPLTLRERAPPAFG